MHLIQPTPQTAGMLISWIYFNKRMDVFDWTWSVWTILEESSAETESLLVRWEQTMKCLHLKHAACVLTTPCCNQTPDSVDSVSRKCRVTMATEASNTLWGWSRRTILHRIIASSVTVWKAVIKMWGERERNENSNKPCVPSGFERLKPSQVTLELLM